MQMKYEEGQIQLEISLGKERKEPRHSSKLVIFHDGKISR